MMQILLEELFLQSISLLCMLSFRAALSNGSVMGATYVILNFLAAELKNVKRNRWH